MRSLTTMSVFVLLAASMAAGCKSGVITLRGMSDGGVGDPTADGGGPDPVELFSTQVEPMLTTRCGACHGEGRTAIDFLRPDPDIRTTILSIPALVDLSAPRGSRLLTKGEHSGPALRPGDASMVLSWIEAEARAGTMVMPRERELATTPVAIEEGFTMLPLDSLDLPGTAIHFVATRVGSGIFLDNVALAAGPLGARIVHPIFVVWIDGIPNPDPVDRFASLDLRVEPTRTASFDTGSVALTDFPVGAELSVHFTVVEPARGMVMPGADGGVPMPTGGCAQLPAFRSTAVPALMASCTRCHGGGNASATAAMDMSRVAAAADPTAVLGCNQVLGRISATSPMTSGLFVQPDPAAGGAHPFKFGSAAELNSFRSSILAWFEMETP